MSAVLYSNVFGDWTGSETMRGDSHLIFKHKYITEAAWLVITLLSKSLYKTDAAAAPPQNNISHAHLHAKETH